MWDHYTETSRKGQTASFYVFENQREIQCAKRAMSSTHNTAAVILTAATLYFSMCAGAAVIAAAFLLLAA